MARNIFRGFVSVFSADIGVLLLSAAITPLLVRVLTSAEYGDYAFVLAVLSIIMIVVNAGIFDGTRKYIAEVHEGNWQTHVFAFYFRIAGILALTASASLIGVISSGLVEAQLGKQFNIYFYMLTALIIVRQFWAFGRGTLMGLGHEHLSEPMKLLRWILFALVGLPLAAYGYDVIGLLFGRIVARGLVGIAAFYFVTKHIPYAAIAESIPTTFPRRELLSYNSLSIVLILLTNSLYKTDLLLLKPLAGSATTGYYNAALVAAQFVWLAPTALQTVFLQSTSEMWSQNRNTAITNLISRATRYVVLFTALLCIGLFALADVFVPLYFGSEFEPAITPLRLLLPGVFGFAIARPIFAVGQGKGDLRVLVYATGASALLNLVLNLLLIPRYGTNGAAIATSIGYASMVVFHVLGARQIGFDPIADLRLGQVIATVAVSIPSILFLASVTKPSLISLVVVPPVGFVVHSLAAIAFGAIDLAELREIRQQVPIDILSR